ncbi:hypothetical protein [uncultured Fibrobacter sp.]|uniref:hypothetical protein n=1 Tax=uncultured Fibrobacter sp. TaxID=261512 RepID=UPI0025EE035A|nr:hypothetical protein [uncultured Fibrobacter sp.]
MDKDKIQHKELAAGRWAEMPLALQMLNIGSEISRANRWKTKGNQVQVERAVFRALELIDLTIEAQRGKHNLKEFTRMRETICDYFLGDNIYRSTGKQIQRDFDMFLLGSK